MCGGNIGEKAKAKRAPEQSIVPKILNALRIDWECKFIFVSSGFSLGEVCIQYNRF